MNLLVGKHIGLRALEPDDLELLYTWENDTSIWQVSNTLVPFSRSVLQAYLDNAHLDIYTTKQVRFVIYNLTDATALGFIDLFDFDPLHKRAGVGILIGSEQQRGKGFASDALSVLKKYSQEVLQLKQLYCSITATNTHSIQLFQGAGFTVTGTKLKWTRMGDNFVDELFLQCLLS